MSTVRAVVGRGRRRAITLGTATFVALGLVLALLGPALAYGVSLPNSNFEIEDPAQREAPKVQF